MPKIGCLDSVTNSETSASKVNTIQYAVYLIIL